MAARFRAFLNVLGSQSGAAAAVAAFALQEGYNTGWGGKATIIGTGRSGTMSAGDMFGYLMATGVRAGRPVSLELVMSREESSDAAVRTWPCVIESLQPYQLGGSAAACDIHLLDPVSFLAEQPIWGAYRSVSAGKIVGAALSLAAGGDGKPTLSPLLPGLPTLRVTEGYRDELNTVEYAIAAGQTLGDWLAEFLALLSLRAELSLSLDGQALVLELLDSVPRRHPLAMTVVSDGEEADRDEAAESIPASRNGDDPYDGGGGRSSDDGRILITGHAGFPGARRRGGLLDDPTVGSARVVYAPGSIGSVLTGPGLDVEEAGRRIHGALLGTYAEMIMVSAISGQPRIGVGDLVTPSRPVHDVATWQVAGVKHMLRSGAYDNDLTLLRGDIPWHPELPLYHPPVYVTGIVDGGNDFTIHEPVPRDRLGRIEVSFPFTPTPVGQEAAELAAADTTRDGRVLLDDFSESQIASFTDDREQWEGKVAQYEAGEFADPYPGREDDDLSAEEQANRDALDASRREALAYMAYKKVSGDRDHDGIISDRDTLISEDLSDELKTSSGREEMQTLWNMSRERRERYLRERLARKILARDGNLREEEVEQSAIDAALANPDSQFQSKFDEMAESEIAAKKTLVEEYGELFETPSDELSQETLAARQDAQEKDVWPPRIPLSIIIPMAGAMHGFISAHRHGDICRVAVHNPLSAEIVGFQYREDRKINTGISGAVAGLVVEHNYSQAWSGLMFKRSDDEETADEDASGDGGNGQSDTGGNS